MLSYNHLRQVFLCKSHFRLKCRLWIYLSRQFRVGNIWCSQLTICHFQFWLSDFFSRHFWCHSQFWLSDFFSRHFWCNSQFWLLDFFSRHFWCNSQIWLSDFQTDRIWCEEPHCKLPNSVVGWRLPRRQDPWTTTRVWNGKWICPFFSNEIFFCVGIHPHAPGAVVGNLTLSSRVGIWIESALESESDLSRNTYPSSILFVGNLTFSSRVVW